MDSRRNHHTTYYKTYNKYTIKITYKSVFTGYELLISYNPQRKINVRQNINKTLMIHIPHHIYMLISI